MTTSLQSLPPWEQSTRGQGLIARDSYVSKRAYVGPAATIQAGAEMFGQSRAEGTTELGRLVRLSGNCVVRGSKLFDFSGVADNAQVINSILKADAALTDCPFVCDEAMVEDSRLYGQVRVSQKAHLKNVTADGCVELRGSVEVEDCELGLGIIMHEGRWTRSPRIWHTGFSHNIIECVSNEDPMQSKLLAGCKCGTVEFWVKNGRRTGATMGLTDAQMITFAEIIIYNFVPEEFQSEAFARW